MSEIQKLENRETKPIPEIAGNKGLGERSSIYLGLFPAMVLPLFASLLYFVILSDNAFVRPLYLATKAFTLVWPILALKFIEQCVPLFCVVWNRQHVYSAIEGLLSGILLGLILVGAFHFTPLGQYVGRHAAPIQQKVIQLQLVKHYFAFALLLSFVHSALEEYYWRWFVFGRLKQVFSSGWTYLFGSLAFAAHHFVILSQFFSAAGTIFFGLGVAVGGAFWAWLYWRRQSLLGPWISHIVVDLAIFYLGHLIMLQN